MQEEEAVRPLLSPIPLDGEFQRCAGFVPNAITVASEHLKTIVPGRNLSIMSHPPRADLDPVGIQAVQPVLEPNALRLRERQCREIKLDLLPLARS